MRILQLCQKFHPNVASGSTVVVYNISRMLAKRGHQVTVFTSDMKDSSNRLKTSFVEQIDGIDVYRFRSFATFITRNFKWFVTPQIISKLNNIKYFDIIHIHEHRNFQAMIIRYYVKNFAIPYVLQAHGSLPRFKPWDKLKWFYDLLFGYPLLRDASRVVALSSWEAKQYKLIGILEKKIVTIPNGIDLSEYATLPPKGFFKSEYNIPQDKKIILYLGRIHRIKGIDFLIKAYAYLVKKIGYKDAILIIAGPDDGYLNEAKALAKSLKIDDSIIFTGLLSKEEKINALVDSSLCAYLGPYEPFGIVTLEAAAASIPVVICEGTPMSEILKNGNFGFSVRYNDVVSLSSVMLKILDDEELASALGRNGRKYVFENLGWEKIIRKYEQMYKEIIENRV
ncbi:MAG: glycosyltransferase family 4 protein [Thermoproteota archaeon]|nr:glycosyltransferase family 4 protein [Candidatus Brockarchaeota archaeon]